METIIGLLFVLLPVIFKLIGKKLEQSGKDQKAEAMRNLAKQLEGEDDDFWLDSPETKSEDKQEIVLDSVPEAPKVIVVEPVVTENVVRQTLPVRPKASSKKTKPILVEEKTEKKREKIDPKKLVIYSEIMKPKYNE